MSGNLKDEAEKSRRRLQSVYWEGRLKVPFPSENWQLVDVWRLVWVFTCCVTKYHRFSGLKQYPFIIAQWGSRPGTVWLGLLLRVLPAENKAMAGLYSHLELGALPCSLVVGRISFCGWRTKSLLSCWLPARRCSQVLNALIKIQHIVYASHST